MATFRKTLHPRRLPARFARLRHVDVDPDADEPRFGYERACSYCMSQTLPCPCTPELWMEDRRVPRLVRLLFAVRDRVHSRLPRPSFADCWPQPVVRALPSARRIEPSRVEHAMLLHLERLGSLTADDVVRAVGPLDTVCRTYDAGRKLLFWPFFARSIATYEAQPASDEDTLARHLFAGGGAQEWAALQWYPLYYDDIETDAWSTARVVERVVAAAGGDVERLRVLAEAVRDRTGVPLLDDPFDSETAPSPVAALIARDPSIEPGSVAVVLDAVLEDLG